MQVSKVKIVNLLGVDALEFKAGKFVEIVGPNGSGKTSTLEAIKSCIKGGHDATLLRNGEAKGEALLELDSGDAIRTRVNLAKTDRAIISGGKASGGVSEIKALVDAMSVNPVEFLTASPERRASIILESMPIKADPERLLQITGQTVQSDAHALDVIASIRKSIYDDRTLTNGALKQVEAGKARTITTMPNVVEIECDEDALNETKNTLLAEKESSVNALAAKLDGIVGKADLEISELNKQLREIEAQISMKRSFIAEQKSKAALKIQEIKNGFDTKINEINVQLRDVANNRDNLTRLEIAKKDLADADTEIQELSETSEKYTQTLENLDAYKIELMSNLPIPGLEVRKSDGKVYFNGVDFDRVNTAEKVKIAVQIAKFRAGEFPIVCVDGLECLDDSTYEVFKSEMLQSNCQTFVTRVGRAEIDDECELPQAILNTAKGQSVLIRSEG